MGASLAPYYPLLLLQAWGLLVCGVQGPHLWLSAHPSYDLARTWVIRLHYFQHPNDVYSGRLTFKVLLKASADANLE